MKFSISKKIYLLVFAGLILLSSCNNNKQFYTMEGETQGTMYHIKYEYSKNINAEIEEFLVYFSNSLSNYNPESTVSKFNYNSPDFKADSLIIRMVKEAIIAYQNTNGYFDITIAPIANFWGFGWEKPVTIDTSQIVNLLPKIGIEKLAISDNKISKSDPDIMLITNGIAKGMSVDCVAEIFDKKGIENYIIEIGGEVKTKGKKQNGETWKVGIDEPIKGTDYSNRSLQRVIELSDKAICTSGNYRRFIEMDGKTLGHSLNPKTGYPAENDMISASVISDNCGLADAYATAFMVMGFEEAKQVAEQIPDIEVYFIYADKNGEHKTFYSKGLKNFIID